MTIGDIEAVVPYTNANPEEEMRNMLYLKFKETNWWARHPHAWIWASVLYGFALIALAISANNGLISPETVVACALGFVPFIVLLAILKYFAHDRPRNKFEKEWSISPDKWSTNIGGILKIYD